MGIEPEPQSETKSDKLPPTVGRKGVPGRFISKGWVVIEPAEFGNSFQCWVVKEAELLHSLFREILSNSYTDGKINYVLK